MVLQYLSNAGSEGAKRDSIYEYLKFRQKAMFFRRNLSQSVETISVTSNFDGYSESKYTKKRSPAFWRPFLVSYLLRIQNQLLSFHLFTSYRKLYLSWLIACSQYHEGRTLEDQLGASNPKLAMPTRGRVAPRLGRAPPIRQINCSLS